MDSNLAYGKRGYALTKYFEGLKLTAYADQGGVWTVGYGHTGPGVHAGLRITQEQADFFLRIDVSTSVSCVNRYVTTALKQNQFDALVDFVFNLGCGSLLSSQLLRDVNAGNFASAAEQFLRWNHIGKTVVPGLTRRRQAESDLFKAAV